MVDHRQQRERTAMERPVRTGRRRVLAGLGTSLAATLVAGCSSVVDRDPSYADRTVVDVAGDERSAEEMIAAESVAEQEITAGVTPLGVLSIEDHEFVLEDDFRGSTVQGRLANTGDDPVRSVEVRVRVYDDADRHLGRYLDSTGDLDGGTAWEFEVVLLESPDDIGAYDLAALGTQA